MKLIDILDIINRVDNDSVILVPIDSNPDEDTDAIVEKIIIIDEVPGIRIPDGMKYFLEAELAKEVIQVWSDWRNRKIPNKQEKFNAVLYYAEHDAYLPVEDV